MLRLFILIELNIWYGGSLWFSSTMKNRAPCKLDTILERLRESGCAPGPDPVRDLSNPRLEKSVLGVFLAFLPCGPSKFDVCRKPYRAVLDEFAGPDVRQSRRYLVSCDSQLTGLSMCSMSVLRRDLEHEHPRKSVTVRCRLWGPCTWAPLRAGW